MGKKFIENSKKRKKITVVLAALLIVGIFSSTAFAGVYDAGYTYLNPKNIVISQPGLNYKTTGDKVSILGACDFRYPLYMNGEKIETTEHGFFAKYVSLKTGVNRYTFKNNGKTKTVTITKTKAGTTSGTGDVLKLWDQSVQKYGYVVGNNISHLSAIKSGELLLPIAEGTTAKVIGESKDLYYLQDNTYVYKSHFKLLDGNVPTNNITEIIVKPSNSLRCDEVWFKSSAKALYNLTIDGAGANLTLFNTKSMEAPANFTPNSIVKNVEKTLEDGDKVTYRINFNDGALHNGYYVEFEDGYTILGFKERPTLTGDRLDGVRIFIDGGHGGSDTGAKGPLDVFGPLEKNINLNMALYAKEYLKSKGAEVIMTRTDDTATALEARAKLISSLKPDLSISLHNNSKAVTSNYLKSQGFLTYYSFDLGNSPQNVMSEYISKALSIGVNTANQSNLAMTRATNCPAVLFEGAFMSSPTDYEWLIKNNTQRNYGRAVGEAAENFIKMIGTKNNQVTIVVNEKILKTDQPAFIKENRTLVPMRAIFEALGSEVTWDNEARTVKATRNDVEISLIVDSTSMTITKDGKAKTVELDVKPQIVNDRTMVPLRAVSEALNAKVTWNQEEYKVDITL